MAANQEASNESVDVELDQFRQVMRTWVEKNLDRPRARELDEQRSVPMEIWTSLAEIGVTGLQVPTEYGGGGADVRFDYLAIEELGRRYASLGADFMVVSMAGRFLTMNATPAQRQELLPGLAGGDALVSFGLTEPGTGTDLAALRTRARRDGDSWVITGQKLYITLAADARTLIVLARTREPREGARPSDGLSLIVVPTNQPGIEVRRLAMAGLRGAGTTEVFLDDAHAPADAVIGEEGNGLAALVGTLNHERILQAFLAVGIGQAAWEDAREFALQRTAFGRVIGSFQAVQHPLAQSYIDLEAARLLNAKAAAAEASGASSVMEAAVAKHFAGEAAALTTDRAMRIAAGHGLTEESDLMRYHRDVRDMVSGPLSNEMARNLIAERCGFPRSY